MKSLAAMAGAETVRRRGSELAWKVTAALPPLPWAGDPVPAFLRRPTSRLTPVLLAAIWTAARKRYLPAVGVVTRSVFVTVECIESVSKSSVSHAWLLFHEPLVAIDHAPEWRTRH